MLILHDPRCAEYGSSTRPEQPARAIETAKHLRGAHPEWPWQIPASDLDDSTLLLAHTAAHLLRLRQPQDFADATPSLRGIADHARRAAAGGVKAAVAAHSGGGPVFSLMRPPGHHATSDQAMGFCYLNSIAIAALYAMRVLGLKRVAVWDFDAHHGNGTEFILHAQQAPERFFFASVHQYPGYPGTGTQDHGPSVRNWPVAPRSSRVTHLAALRASWDAVISFDPELILVSAGFDAYSGDPITDLTLEREDFATLGEWLGQSRRPAAALLEGGYSGDLPLLVDAFLSAWENARLPA
jgi:acetoin utilization deacetylase AcuC-like enzyme